MKHLHKIGITLLLILLLPGVLLAEELYLPSFYGESYYAQLPAMVQRLEQAEEPRLVLVGGSNVAFGVDTDLLQEILRQQGFSYTVCPLGLYAAVGCSAMLDLAENSLRRGDVVVLSVEPTNETMSAYFGATAYWKCAEDAPELLFRLDADKSAALAGSYVPHLQERWAILRSGIYPKAEGVYARAAFNDSCNMTYPRDGNTMTLGFDPATPIDMAGLTISHEFARQVNSFCQEAAAKGAQVFFSFCPMNRSAIQDSSQEALRQFFTRCNETFSCPIISDPSRYILDSGWFYDSNFHLNTPGAVLRTQLLAEDILAALGCYHSLSLEPPTMPEPIAAPLRTQSGDDCFLFVPTEDGSGLLVSGLTEIGLEAVELTVPGTYNGLPVVGFANGALASAKQLEQLWLPPTILFLQEDLFRDCSALTRLVLEHTDTPCPIAAHALDDVPRLRIFVPERVYHLYRDGYGCQQNLWTAYLDRILTY